MQDIAQYIHEVNMRPLSYAALKNNKVTTITCFGVPYQIFTRKYADINQIYYIEHWQNKDITVGDYILSDDNFIVPVLMQNTKLITVPFNSHYRSCFYFFLTAGTVRDHPIFADNVGLLNVEKLFIIGFRKTLNIKDAIRYVFGNVKPRRMRDLLSYVNFNPRLRNAMMGEIETLFKESKTDVMACVKHIMINAEMLEAFVAKLIDTPDAKVEEVLKAIAASHQLNSEIIGLATGQSGQLSEISGASGFALTEHN
jgi:hypothetical protein